MKTADEIFNEMAEIDKENVCLGNLFTMFKSKVLAAMEEYASQFKQVSDEEINPYLLTGDELKRAEKFKQG